MPNSVVVSPSTFATSILPAFQPSQRSEGSVLKTFPVQELDVQVDRVTAALRPRPGAAPDPADRRLPHRHRARPGLPHRQHLQRARGRPGRRRRRQADVRLPRPPRRVLAAFLAAYAGHILASTQRREQANLRIRGANRSPPGADAGAAQHPAHRGGCGDRSGGGFPAALAVLGGDALLRASTPSLVVSGLIGGRGRLPRRRVGALRRGPGLDPAGDQRGPRPAVLPAAAVGALPARPAAAARRRRPRGARVRADAFAGIPGSVYEGRAWTCPCGCSRCPWVCGSPVTDRGRAFAWVLSRRRSRSTGFPRVVRGTLGAACAAGPGWPPRVRS